MSDKVLLIWESTKTRFEGEDESCEYELTIQNPPDGSKYWTEFEITPTLTGHRETARNVFAKDEISELDREYEDIMYVAKII